MFFNTSGDSNRCVHTSIRVCRHPYFCRPMAYAVTSVTCFTILIYIIYVYIHYLNIIIIILKVGFICDRCDCTNDFVKPNEQSQARLSYAMAKTEETARAVTSLLVGDA